MQKEENLTEQATLPPSLYLTLPLHAKGVFSVCHSIGTGGSHSCRVKRFERCFEVANYRLNLSRRQHYHRPAILQVPRTQNKLYEPRLGNTNCLRGINESHLGNEKPATGIVQPHLGITKPTEGLNMSCLRNEFDGRCTYFITQVKTPITGQTYLSDHNEIA